MMIERGALSPLQLASLDLMITSAQSRGLSFDDVLEDDNEQAEAQAERVEAMWEARHGGLEISDHDREVLARIRELASTLESGVTLGQLVEMRGQALRRQ